jgi:hypothetical protein
VGQPSGFAAPGSPLVSFSSSFWYDLVQFKLKMPVFGENKIGIGA